MVGTKTPPLFGEALRMGALLGGAPAAVAEQLADLGRALGRFIQVSDDVTDALETPARADWQRPSNSLPLLFAMTAGHAEREEFLAPVGAGRRAGGARRGAEDPLPLRRGQLLHAQADRARARGAGTARAGIPLRDPEPIEQLLEVHIAAVVPVAGERSASRIPAALASLGIFAGCMRGFRRSGTMI